VILRLESQHLASIKAHAEGTYPEECCGLLLGKSDPTGKTVMEVRATTNHWQNGIHPDSGFTKHRRYEIAPAEMLATMKDGRDRDLDIIGIYHSHPDHPAEPSECDRQSAWPQYSYPIVSVPKGIAGTVRSWSLNEQSHFEEEAILIQDSGLR
jgi:proteasome lid subunit RPN8/RPN11